MNLLLFENPFERICIDQADARTQHLREVLQVKKGSLVFVGFINGARARAQVVELPDDGSVHLEVVGIEPAPQPYQSICL